VLVRNGHYDADGYKKDGADGEREEEAVPGEVNWVAVGKGLERLFYECVLGLKSWMNRVEDKNEIRDPLAEKERKRGILFANEDPNNCHRDKSNKIPTQWRISISFHQPIMNIFLADNILHS